MTEFTLTFHNNVVEHLGLKLYQNKPTSVIAEIVSNSWDASAQEVLIELMMESSDLNARWLSVIDDGHGMDRNALVNSFLVIGKSPSRPRAGTNRVRALMGRKGIGKLAPFGIARLVDVVTLGRSEGGQDELTWLRLSLDSILDAGPAADYRPEVIYAGSNPSLLPFEQDASGEVAKWRDHIQREANVRGCGTLVLMHRLSLRRALGEQQLIESLGRRFTVSPEDLFTVIVNGSRVEPSISLPAFEFRIPNDSTYEEVDVAGRPVKYWVGFVKEADWAQDQAGVGVYAHRKLAQDRPFSFGAKGVEIWTRYMYAVVEADWLDELSEDLISTDRTSVNWDNDATRPLFEWGQKKVGEWARRFSTWRREQERSENSTRMKAEIASRGIASVTEAEGEQILNLLSQITPRMGKDETAKTELLRVVNAAWTQEPMRKLVKDLWGELGESHQLAPDQFSELIKRLSSFGIPESLNLAVVFAQRAFALTKLYEYVHTGSEPDLQRLITRFPWIVEPDSTILTANESLKTAVERADKLNLIPNALRPSSIGGIPGRYKPDFIFLSSPDEHELVVVELKSPQEDLTLENRTQLQNYMTYLEGLYGKSKISGVLIGRQPSGRLEAKFAGTRIVEWTEVLRVSRARNIDLLAAMLLQAAPNSGSDARIEAAVRLGGAEAKKVLERLASHHQELRKIMDQFGPMSSTGSSEPEGNK